MFRKPVHCFITFSKSMINIHRPIKFKPIFDRHQDKAITIRLSKVPIHHVDCQQAITFNNNTSTTLIPSKCQDLKNCHNFAAIISHVSIFIAKPITTRHKRIDDLSNI